MSSRVGVEKVTYLCADGHVTRQRADKETPKKCSVRGCENKPFDPESKSAEQQAAQIFADAPITPKRKKVTKEAKKKQKEKTK